MSTPPISGPRTPPSAEGGSLPLGQDSAPAGGASLALLCLQRDALQQLADLAAQQAAARTKATMASSAQQVMAPSAALLQLDHETLRNLNQSVGGLAALMAQARLLADSEDMDSSASGYYNSDVAELQALGKGLADLVEGSKACGNLTAPNGTPLSELETQVVKALQNLPSSALAMILYASLYGSDMSRNESQFSTDLEALKDSDSALAPLAEKALQVGSGGLPVPQNGKWEVNDLNQCSWALTTWFKDPSEGGAWGKMAVAGFQASLTPWLQILGQNGNATGNTDVGCLQTISLSLLALLDLGGDPSLFINMYQSGSGILSLGFFMNIEVASYFQNSVASKVAPQGPGALNQQLANMAGRLEKLYPQNRVIQSQLEAIRNSLDQMAGNPASDPPVAPSLQALTHASDRLAAPLMAAWFGGIPATLTPAEALAEAKSLFSLEKIRLDARTPSPVREDLMELSKRDEEKKRRL
jgi:hypothetical protein